MNQSTENVAKSIFNGDWERLTPYEREVIEGVLSKIGGPRDVNKEFIRRSSFGERASDAIAAFGGSWTFILIFFAALVFWTVVNTEILGPLKEAFDPLSLRVPQSDFIHACGYSGANYYDVPE
jgi:uncharacterized membrane protein